MCIKSAVRSPFWLEQMGKAENAYDDSGVYYTFAGVALDDMDKQEIIAAWHHMNETVGFPYGEDRKTLASVNPWRHDEGAS